ncbi:hypothetical protein FACHB389_25650 [Nostoc calcicola FACHB-389]|nr:hypothetical protein [Nostoc calcicola FACHB-3891]OKH29739.1 hypothetical protein FACHB389_25650 [Nostoc calcicola FACHB-389]
MDFEEVFKVLDANVLAKTKRHLKDVEKFVLRGAWQGQTYEEMAKASNYCYTPSYLKQDVGPNVWKLLSETLEEKVSKTNFRAALERRAQFREVQKTQKSAGAKPTILTALENSTYEELIEILFAVQANLEKMLVFQKRKNSFTAR